MNQTANRHHGCEPGRRQLAPRPRAFARRPLAAERSKLDCTRLGTKGELCPLLTLAHDRNISWRVQLIAQARRACTSCNGGSTPGEPSGCGCMGKKGDFSIGHDTSNFWSCAPSLKTAAAADKLERFERRSLRLLCYCSNSRREAALAWRIVRHHLQPTPVRSR